MKAIKILSLNILFFFVGCVSTSELSILSDFDESVDFNNYTTFVICVDDLFVENTKYPKYDNNHVRQLIGKEIEDQMTGQGYKTNVIKPELQAGFQILIVEEEATFTNCNLQDDYDYWKTCTINTVTYTEETLVVYVSDLQKNQVVWQASTSCDLNKPKSALKKYVMNLVEGLFNSYPKTN